MYVLLKMGISHRHVSLLHNQQWLSEFELSHFFKPWFREDVCLRLNWAIFFRKIHHRGGVALKTQNITQVFGGAL